jgi:hypothetical protein
LVNGLRAIHYLLYSNANLEEEDKPVSLADEDI